jgi:hypothetical protein
MENVPIWMLFAAVLVLGAIAGLSAAVYYYRRDRGR